MMAPTNEDSGKPVNLGEITVTIDDATVHLVGMIDELSEETSRKIDGINATINELKGELKGLKELLENG
jgi:hypothetical protein